MQIDRPEAVASGVMGFRIEITTTQLGHEAQKILYDNQRGFANQRRNDLDRRARALCRSGYNVIGSEPATLRTTLVSAIVTETFVIACR